MGQEGPSELYLKQLVIDFCKHTLLLKGVGLAFVAREEGAIPPTVPHRA